MMHCIIFTSGILFTENIKKMLSLNWFNVAIATTATFGLGITLEKPKMANERGVVANTYF